MPEVAEQVLFHHCLARRTATARWLMATAQEKAIVEVLKTLGEERQRLGAAVTSSDAALQHIIENQPEVQDGPSPAVTGDGGELEVVEAAVRTAEERVSAWVAGAPPGQDDVVLAPRRDSPPSHLPVTSETANDIVGPSTSRGEPSRRPRNFRPANHHEENSSSDDSHQSEQELTRLQRRDARWRLEAAVTGVVMEEVNEEVEPAAARRRIRVRGSSKGKKGGRNFGKKR